MKYDPGCSSRIPDLDLYFLPIQDPGSRGQKGTGSRIRIRNTARYKQFLSQQTELCKCCLYRVKLSLLKVHKIEIFFGFDFEICIISLLVMSKY
jgi:hypothetical protein